MTQSAASVAPGRLIVVNGASSTGKSSLCNALQDLLEEPYVQLGYDRAWMTLPTRYFPFQANEREGAWYDLDPNDPTVAVGFGLGWVARQAISGLHHMVAALVASGSSVIVDVLFMEPAMFEEAMRLWRPYRPLLVNLKAPLEVSLSWEAERADTQGGRPKGLTRVFRDEIYAHAGFDLELDSSLGTPEDTARLVIAQLHETSVPDGALNG